jgi:hypothetical protein
VTDDEKLGELIEAASRLELEGDQRCIRDLLIEVARRLVRRRGKAPAYGGVAADPAEGQTVEQVAALLNLSPRRVQQLAKEKVFAQLRRGRYDAPACVRAYVNYSRDRAREPAERGRTKTADLVEGGPC